MSRHNHNQNQQQQQQQPGKKKVEWNSNLSSSEPQPTENVSPIWDSEADHMLSYFLDGSGIASPPKPNSHARFPHSAVSANRAHPGASSAAIAASGRGNRPVISDRILQHPFRTNNFPGNSSGPSSMASMDNTSCSHHDDNVHRQPPPTPVIQHYFPSASSSSSSQKTASNQSPSNPGLSTISSGVPLPMQTPHFPYGQHHQHQYQQHHQQKQQQHQQHQHHQQHHRKQQMDPIQEMKQNFMGAYYQQHTSRAGSNPQNAFAFQGYNAAMEETVSPISPALAFGGDYEPLLLPNKGTSQPPKPNQKSQSEFLSQLNTLAGAYNENVSANAYGISSSNPTNLSSTNTTVANNTSVHSVALNKLQPMVVSSQPADVHAPQQLSQAVVATQKQFAQSIPSSASVATATMATNPNPTVVSAPNMGSFPQPGVAPPVHPMAAAALLAGVGVGANHPFFFPNHLTAAYLMQKAESVEETEEKRAKRLERNRESARKSRRRKKERLSNLGGKVSKLYGKIEKERRVQINSMDTKWKAFGQEDLFELKKQQSSSKLNTSDLGGDGLSQLFIGEKEQFIRKEVVEYQYNSLVQHLLPRYQKYLISTILQSESYFLAGKEEHSERDFSKKITTGKISSKQIGEEIANGPKLPSPSPLNQDQPQGNQVACVSDAEKFWPLVCFELSISVEQEERFLEKHGKLRQIETLKKNMSEIVAATRLAASAKECVIYQIYLSAFRKRKTYSDILTPRQAILYQEWLLSNRDRATKITLERRKWSSASPIQRGGIELEGPDGEQHEDLSLEKLCRYLEESLKISKNQPY